MNQRAASRAIFLLYALLLQDTSCAANQRPEISLAAELIQCLAVEFDQCAVFFADDEQGRCAQPRQRIRAREIGPAAARYHRGDAVRSRGGELQRGGRVAVDSEEALARNRPLRRRNPGRRRGNARSNARVRRDHLAYRDGWDLSDVEPEQIHLMVPCMEAWIAADPDGIALYNIRTATTDSTPSIGSSALAVSNRKSSSPQPVFSTWWKSSIRRR